MQVLKIDVLRIQYCIDVKCVELEDSYISIVGDSV